MSDATRRAAVTGASGYVGGLIAEALEAAGWEVVRLVRTLPSGDDAGQKYRQHRLTDTPADELLEGVELLVHAAYDFSLTRRDDIWSVNVDGTAQLLAAARRAGLSRMVVLSSMSAYPGTTQLYGQAKLAIEDAGFAHGAAVIRPGLVYGDRPGGMVGSLLRFTRFPVAPVVAPKAKQYPVHEDDLAGAVVALAEAESVPLEALGVASPVPVAFGTLLETLAATAGRRCHFVAVPWRLVYWALRVAETTPVRLPFRADSLLGLARAAPFVPGVDRLAEMGVVVRPFPTLHRPDSPAGS